MQAGKKACVIAGLFFSFLFPSFGQDQHLADSLATLYRQGRFQGVELMDLLSDLSFNEYRDREQSLKYAEELIALAEKEGHGRFLANGYLRKGTALMFMGESEEALQAFFSSAREAQNADAASIEGAAYLAIADVYSAMENPDNAGTYYGNAIRILRQQADTLVLAGALLNAGDFYFTQRNYPRALAYFEESGTLYNLLDYPIGTAYNKGNIGMVMAETGNDAAALRNMNEAIALLEEIEDYYPICVYLTYLSDIYLGQGDYQTALAYARRSLELATRYGLVEQIRDAHLKLSELYDYAGEPQNAFRHYRDHVEFRDSLRNIEAVQEMANVRTNFEVSQKQAEVDLLNQQKRTQRIIVIATGVALALILIIAVGLYRRNRFVRETNRVIESERDRSDALLRNILPEETAAELKESGRVKPRKFESVSILFTDFKGFTAYAEKMSPEDLVEKVDLYFSKFDEIIAAHGLEKIKTIGDAYMCAGGLPFPMADHAKKTVEAALDIVRFVREAAAALPEGQPRFDIRIGINTGPVVAGVVGTRKFAYDIWGDAVNIASRMESNSEPGRINISEDTYLLVRDAFTCHYRGEIEVKNRGRLRMYFVEEPGGQV